MITQIVFIKVEPTEQNIEYLVNGVRATPDDDGEDDADDADLSENEGSDDSEWMHVKFVEMLSESPERDFIGLHKYQ